MKYKPANYGCGGKVVKSYQDGGKVAKKAKKKPQPKPEHLGTGMASKAGEHLRDRGKRLRDKEKELGLRDGGPPMKPGDREAAKNSMREMGAWAKEQKAQMKANPRSARLAQQNQSRGSALSNPANYRKSEPMTGKGKAAGTAMGLPSSGGGKMRKNKPMKPPEKGGKPKKITTPGKPGDTGPWGANPARNRKKK